MLPTINDKGDTCCAWCNRMHRRAGWFCSPACDWSERLHRAGVALRDPQLIAHVKEAPCQTGREGGNCDVCNPG
jgi:hypothetical protein